MTQCKHIPDGRELSEDRAPQGSEPTGRVRTYCGRVVALHRCINIDRDCIEDATCRACHRSDDRRVREDYQRETRGAVA